MYRQKERGGDWKRFTWYNLNSRKMKSCLNLADYQINWWITSIYCKSIWVYWKHQFFSFLENSFLCLCFLNCIMILADSLIAHSRIGTDIIKNLIKSWASEVWPLNMLLCWHRCLEQLLSSLTPLLFLLFKVAGLQVQSITKGLHLLILDTVLWCNAIFSFCLFKFLLRICAQLCSQ